MRPRRRRGADAFDARRSFLARRPSRQAATQVDPMTPKSRSLILATLCGLACAARLDAAETFDTGRATSGARIDAAAAEATADAAPTVVLLGGLAGEDATSTAVRDAVAAFEAGGTRGLRLLAVPVANPDAVPLAFPPAGVRSEEHT